MGKKKIAIVDLSQQEQVQYKAAGTRSQQLKKTKVKPDVPVAEPVLAKQPKTSKYQEKLTKKATAKADKVKAKKKTKVRIKHPRSQRYLESKKLIDSKKLYPIPEAIKLLRQVSQVKFNATVEIHCNLSISKLSGEINLPHGSGKTKKIAIANDSILAKLKDGVIDFDVLIAEPEMMPKLAKFAKLLGPKGLMPNPKTGTIGDQPEQIKKKLSGGSIRFRSETKAPLVHLTIGKLSFKDKQLEENINAAIKAIVLKNLTAVYLCSSMSPSIRLQVKDSS